jgi:hypothetical protein
MAVMAPVKMDTHSAESELVVVVLAIWGPLPDRTIRPDV